MQDKGEIVFYQTEDGQTKLSVNLQDETVWLTQDQMAELFQRDKSTISRHIKNVFEEKELDINRVVANFATTASDGKTYQVTRKFGISEFSTTVTGGIKICLHTKEQLN